MIFPQDHPDNCPWCEVSLIGTPLPEEVREEYPGQTHFRREVGIAVSEVYPGVLFWTCADCGGCWPRAFTRPDLDDLARKWALKSHLEQYRDR